MPELRSGTVTSPDPAATVADPTVCPSIAELMPILDRASAAEPAGEGKEWVIACVNFIAPEFGKTDGRDCTWCWWIRFRAPIDAHINDTKARAREIVRAMYAPPVEYQESCDFCRSEVGKPRFVIPDEKFALIEITPRDMYTSDDDYDAAIGSEVTIAACKKMKGARDAKRTQAEKHEAQIQEFKWRQQKELDAFRANLE